MRQLKDYYDKRYKSTIDYINTGKGQPKFKRLAFPNIRKILGPLDNWIYNSCEEYFSEDVYEEVKQAMSILSFTKDCNFKSIKNNYYKLCRGDNKLGIEGWHPDSGGHKTAFDILNHAYNIFKNANKRN